MSKPSEYAARQIEHAYRRMATEVRYRPTAPGDALGSIYMPIDELDIDQEIRDYTERWWDEEDHGTYHVGSPNGEYREAMIFAIEAARLTCGVQGAGHALKLLRMAVEELEKHVDEVDP